MKKITYHRIAERKLKRMPRNDRKRVIEKINQYAENPSSLANNVIRMTGVSFYRLRVGDWRVIFDEDDTVIDVIRIDARGNIYT